MDDTSPNLVAQYRRNLRASLAQLLPGSGEAPSREGLYQARELTQHRDEESAVRPDASEPGRRTGTTLTEQRLIDSLYRGGARVAVVGEPGMGKSELLRQVAWLLATEGAADREGEHRPVPVLIPAKFVMAYGMPNKAIRPTEYLLGLLNDTLARLDWPTCQADSGSMAQGGRWHKR